MSILFDANDDVISCGTSDALLTENGALTISAWLNVSGVGEGGTTAVVIGKRTTGSGHGMELLLSNGTNRQILFFVDATTNLQRRADVNSYPAFGTLFHLLVTWDGVVTTASSVHMYVNGAEVSYSETTDGAGDQDNSADTIRIGQRSDGTVTYNGYISELAVWNKVLSASEIAYLYGNGSPLRGAPMNISFGNNLKAYWPLCEDVGGTVNSASNYVKDYSGLKNHGTQTGDPVYSANPSNIKCVKPTYPSSLGRFGF